MHLFSLALFVLSTVALFWALIGVMAPRFVRLGTVWRATMLAGFAFIGMIAAVQLDPLRPTAQGSALPLLAGWALLWLAAAALRRAMRR